MRWVAITIALSLAMLLMLYDNGPRSGAPAPFISIGDVLSESGADPGFEKADRKHAFKFPHDHGPHPNFRSEWWYFTGNLNDPEGRGFGFQLTLFRFALGSTESESDSAWRSRQIMLGHFAVSDIDAGRYYPHERMSRAALELAGTRTEPLSIWIDSWRIELADPAAGTWKLYADTPDTRLALELRAVRPVTLQGDEGLSRKSSSPGNASYYYSISRLEASGLIATPAGRFEVIGSAWLDREWSTSALSQDQIGWDWFALQLNDGSDVMFYRLRLADGSPDPHSRGVLLAPDRESVTLTATDVEISSRDHWRSPSTDVRYPGGWRLLVPGQDIDLSITPRLKDQEWAHMIPYWEGAVTISGSRRGTPVSGLGYVELTGYDR